METTNATYSIVSKVGTLVKRVIWRQVSCMAERSQAPSSIPPRKRLSASDARERILQAAERKLAEVGPEGLRLTEIAAELGISHPAILHHFGKREDLIVAVVTRASLRFNERLMQVIGSNLRRRDAILDMVAEYFGAEGTARLLAWLVLSKRARMPRRTTGTSPLKRVIDLVHAQRAQNYPERTVDLEDSKFRSQLTAFALLGEALFGDLLRHAIDDPSGPEQSREFRRRLAKLLADNP